MPSAVKHPRTDRQDRLRQAQASHVFGFVEAADAALVNGLLKPGFPWGGLILPIRGAESSFGFTPQEAFSLLQQWPKHLGFVAAPQDIEAWSAVNGWPMAGLYVSASMHQALQVCPVPVAAAKHPVFICVNQMASEETGQLSRFYPRLQSLVVDSTESDLLSADLIRLWWRTKRWGWPVSLHCQVEDPGEPLNALCFEPAALILSCQAPLEALTESLQDCFDLMATFEQSVRMLHPLATPEELDQQEAKRLSLAAARHLRRGETLSEDCFKIKQGTGGISANLIKQLTGCKLLYDLEENEPVSFGLLDWS